MNWEEASAIGQMLGTVAVFITLGYLAVQVRHARDEVRRSITQARTEMVRQQGMTFATDAGISGLFVKVAEALGWQPSPFAAELVERAGVTRDEANRLQAVENAWWQIRSQTMRYLDLLPTWKRAEFETRMRWIYGGETLDALWYRTTKTTLSPELTRYIDNLLAQPG